MSSFWAQPYIDWKGCSAIVCGGDDSRESNCLADYVLQAIRQNMIQLVGVSGASGCGVNPDGTWYETKKLLKRVFYFPKT